MYAVISFVVALLAGTFGYTGIGGDAAAAGKVFFIAFLLLAALFLVIGLLAGKFVL
jgi:uncharacterized membrane protein YtjA (UPF0391 family)